MQDSKTSRLKTDFSCSSLFTTKSRICDCPWTPTHSLKRQLIRNVSILPNRVLFTNFFMRVDWCCSASRVSEKTERVAQRVQCCSQSVCHIVFSTNISRTTFTSCCTHSVWEHPFFHSLVQVPISLLRVRSNCLCARCFCSHGWLPCYRSSLL